MSKVFKKYKINLSRVTEVPTTLSRGKFTNPKFQQQKFAFLVTKTKFLEIFSFG